MSRWDTRDGSDCPIPDSLRHEGRFRMSRYVQLETRGTVPDVLFRTALNHGRRFLPGRYPVPHRNCLLVIHSIFQETQETINETEKT